jgi:hypothetical protein
LQATYFERNKHTRMNQSGHYYRAAATRRFIGSANPLMLFHPTVVVSSATLALVSRLIHTRINQAGH